MWEKVVLNLLSNAVKFTFDGRHHRRACAGRRLRRPHRRRHRHRHPGRGAAPAVRAVPPGRAAPARAPARAAASAWRWCASWWGCTAARSPPRASPDVGTTFTVTPPPRARRTCRPSRSPADAGAAGRVHRPPRRSSPRRCAGCPTRARPAARRCRASTPPTPTPWRVAPGRVLVADDNADMREYLHRLLAPRYAVEVVPDGQAALEAALAAPPDLVVSDVMMPRLDGMELLAALRADARTARVPVLLLSARAGEEAAVEGLAAGADDYLVKPFSAQELLARVGAHLELGRVRREAEERFTRDGRPRPGADLGGRRRRAGGSSSTPGWQEFTGASGTEDLEHGWRDRLHPEDRDRYLEVRPRGRGRAPPWEVEYRLRRADGAYHWLLERAVPARRRRRASPGTSAAAPTSTRGTGRAQRQSLLAEVGATLDRAGGVDEQLAQLARLLVTTPAGRRLRRPARRRRRAAGPGRRGRAGPGDRGRHRVPATRRPTRPGRPSRPAARCSSARCPSGADTGPRYARPELAARRQQLAVSSGAGRPADRAGARPRRARARAAAGRARLQRGRPGARRGDRRAGPRWPWTTRCCWPTSGPAPSGWPCCSGPPPRCRPRPRRSRSADRRRATSPQLLGEGCAVGVYEVDEARARARPR